MDATLPLDSDFWNLKSSETLSFTERAATITDRLTGIIRQREIEPDKFQLLQTVYNPGLSVKDVSDKMGWENRKINRYFNRQFGLSLKTFLNIIRFRNAFNSVKDGLLYPELYYYDQSHYIKEVRKYTEKSPRELHKNDGDRFLQFSVNRKP